MGLLGNITIGQYVPKKSFVHSLDPRTKITFTATIITAVFLVNNLYEYIFLAGVIFSIVMMSRIKLSHYLRGVKALWILIALTAVFQLFAGGGTPVFKWWFIVVTDQAINNTVFITLRLVFIILAASVLTLTTSPIQIADGLEELMRFFRLPKEWAHDFSMMMSIAFRFIPVLAVEAEHVMQAQLSRGAKFDRGGLIQRAKGMIPLLIPLFVGAVRMADELAVAMEARCYRGANGRTRYRELKFSARDYLFMTAGVVLVVLVVLY